MSYRYILSLIALIILPGLVRAQSKPFSINVKLGDSTSKTIYLMYFDQVEQKNKQETLLLTNGRVAFNGNVDAPVSARLFTDYSRVDFFIEAGDIHLNSKDSLPNVVVTGGELNADYNVLKIKTDPINNGRYKLNVQRRAALALTPEKAKEINDTWIKKKDSSMVELNEVYEHFIHEMPDNLATIEVLGMRYGPDPDLAIITPLYNSLSDRVRNSVMGKAYGRKLAAIKSVAIGSIAPDFVQPDTSGNSVSLRDFRGKYLLVDFWASWCLPCRAENPNLVKVFDQYKSRNFTILGVSIDKSDARKAWLKAIAKDGLSWTQVADLKGAANTAAMIYEVNFVPQNFLIGPDGIILAKDLIGEQLNKMLEELLKNKP